jgi:hypothetical protein
MTTTTATTITNPASIASLNRGPIPTIFAAPASCLSTLTSVLPTGDLYFGHDLEKYLDAACYPTSTDAAWNLYYCLWLIIQYQETTDSYQIALQYHVHQASTLPRLLRILLVDTKVCIFLLGLQQLRCSAVYHIVISFPVDASLGLITFQRLYGQYERGPASMSI